MKKYIIFKNDLAVGSVELEKLSPNQSSDFIYKEVDDATFDKAIGSMTLDGAGNVIVDAAKNTELKQAAAQRAQRALDVTALKGKAGLTAADQTKVLKYVIENLL